MRHLWTYSISQLIRTTTAYIACYSENQIRKSKRHHLYECLTESFIQIDSADQVTDSFRIETSDWSLRVSHLLIRLFQKH